MNEEIIDTNIKRKYDADVLILFERRTLDYKITILQQTIKRSEAIWAFDDGIHKVNSVSSMQVSPNTFFLKGDGDFSREEKTEFVSIETAEMWLRLLPQCPFIKVVTSREDADKLLLKEETIDDALKSLKLYEEPTDDDIKAMIDLVDLDVFCRIIQSRLKLEYDGSFCGDYERPSMEDIGKINKKWAKKYLQDWAKSKFRFYKLFGNKLTIEKEVDYIPLKNDLTAKIEDLKNKFPLYAPMLSSIDYKCYEENKMVNGYYGSCFRSMVKGNMSLTKFIALYNNNDLNMELSKFYQSKGKTNIYISIDPCDYLTVSINNSGWKSCHNFFNGCYGNAGLSYMHDKTSLVGFSSNGKTKYTGEYRDFEWNNKKWREMIYVSEENSAVAFSRQYPYYEEKYSKVLRELFETTYSNYFNVEDKWLIINNSKKYLNVVHYEHDTGDNPLLYNDISNGYDYKVAINKSDIDKSQKDCLIGRTISRLGNKDNIIDGSESRIW